MGKGTGDVLLRAGLGCTDIGQRLFCLCANSTGFLVGDTLDEEPSAVLRVEEPISREEEGWVNVSFLCVRGPDLPFPTARRRARSVRTCQYASQQAGQTQTQQRPREEGKPRTSCRERERENEKKGWEGRSGWGMADEARQGQERGSAGIAPLG